MPKEKKAPEVESTEALLAEILPEAPTKKQITLGLPNLGSIKRFLKKNIVPIVVLVFIVVLILAVDYLEKTGKTGNKAPKTVATTTSKVEEPKVVTEDTLKEDLKKEFGRDFSLATETWVFLYDQNTKKIIVNESLQSIILRMYNNISALNDNFYEVKDGKYIVKDEKPVLIGNISDYVQREIKKTNTAPQGN